MRPDLEAAIEELEARLARYPEQRHPLQHATAQFHRGAVLIEAGLLEEAEEALRGAARLFDVLSGERAKATNMLGVALRLQGRLADATEAFTSAQACFVAEQLPLEEAAATYNLGLVQAQIGDAPGARASFERARRLFAEHGAPGRAAAAGRELGTALLAAGEPEAAISALEGASDASRRAGDSAGRGLAANALGLAHLAAGHLRAAIEAFRDAIGSHPRAVRPEGYAMAKANLALAYEQAGELPRARLAARQADGTPGASSAVREQARGLLQRLEEGTDDLTMVLDQEATERWPALMREEVLRWADAEPAERRRGAAMWVQGQLGRPEGASALAEAWLGVLLELPPAEMDQLVRATLEVLGDHDDEAQAQFRRSTARAMATFNVPQLMRLQDVFSRTGETLGQAGSWR